MSDRPQRPQAEPPQTESAQADPGRPVTAFAGSRRLASGPLEEVAETLRARGPIPDLLVFDDADGRVVDLDLRGDAAAVRARLRPAPEAAGTGAEAAPRRGRGRPRLGVTAREVTLLPRHWDWLAAQPGGASAALRRLVEAARRDPEARRRAAREAAWRFMQAMAGDAPGFEAASRALFAGDAEGFARQTEGWPADVRDHARRLAARAAPGEG